MKKSLIALSLLSTLVASGASFADGFSDMMDQNQQGKIEAVMLNNIEGRADQLEKLVLSKEARFETDDLTEGKIFASMVTTVLMDLGEIRSKLNSSEGSQVDALDMRIKELESIVSEF